MHSHSPRHPATSFVASPILPSHPFCTPCHAMPYAYPAPPRHAQPAPRLEVQPPTRLDSTMTKSTSTSTTPSDDGSKA
ncbi:hypothetical protein FA13DRAFT_1727374 [Coprinellus micaceus]|uniref:Uncharacterized protein n=1 Tax=Coprinellus micaceus TaxID=71717 RepID=A0A4Y7TS60_COPMI|nr:hypothetical protein FA13DRAFT_1727374 [Coprinellus micaceus]